MIRLLGTLPSRGWNTLKFPLNYLRRDNVLRCDLARGRYLDYKYKMEFDEAQLTELFAFAKTIDLQCGPRSNRDSPAKVCCTFYVLQCQ